MGSRAALAIVPAQDVLGLGSAARMNVPGRARGNWAWRLEDGQLDDTIAARLRAATAKSGRIRQRGQLTAQRSAARSERRTARGPGS
jgi:4-alpha-glucanotransferase